MVVFEYPITVRFQHCDPAGIVFYPRYFEMVNACVEAWFEEALGYSFGRLHKQLHIGIPTVEAKAEYVRPSRLEDQLTLRLQVTKLGRASVSLQIDIVQADELRVTNKVTLVLTDLAAMKSIAWTSQPQLLHAIEAYI
jgi:4-hydroxybenzoyl-CoA thioesterase